MDANEIAARRRAAARVRALIEEGKKAGQNDLARLAAEDARFDADADLAEWQSMYENGRLGGDHK